MIYFIKCKVSLCVGGVCVYKSVDVTGWAIDGQVLTTRGRERDAEGVWKTRNLQDPNLLPLALAVRNDIIIALLPKSNWGKLTLKNGDVDSWAQR